MKRYTLSILSLGLALALAQTAFAETLKKPEIDKLVAARQAKPSPNFSAFLAEVAKANPKLEASVAAYDKKAPLSGDDLINISRLIGVYNRLHNQKAVISTIETMVALPTVRSDNIPPHESKPIIEFGRLVEKMAKDFGLQYRNVDNRVFEVKLPGKGSSPSSSPVWATTFTAAAPSMTRAPSRSCFTR
jgi:hypothetical protein